MLMLFYQQQPVPPKKVRAFLRPCSDVTVPYRFETVFVTDKSRLVSERFRARNGAVPFR